MKSKKELVSVIIPTYNRAKYITEAIDSVLKQTYKNIDIIIVDDGSTDDTKKILKPYMHKIRYFYQENKGVGAARNKGVKESKGKYLAFLDSDDVWKREKLDVQLKRGLQKKTISLHKGSWFVDSKKDNHLLGLEEEISWPTTNKKEDIIDPLVSISNGIYLNVGSLLCNKLDFLKIGFFNENLFAGEDEEWFFRAALKDFRFIHLNKRLIKRRYHNEQTGLGKERAVKSLIKVFRYMAEKTKNKNKQAYYFVLKRLSSKFSHLSNIKIYQNKRLFASLYSFKSFLIYPKNLKRLVKSFLFLFGWKPKNIPKFEK